MTVWTHWCEWDVGFEGAVWASREAAERDIKQALEDAGEDFDETLSAGLVGFDSTEVIE